MSNLRAASAAYDAAFASLIGCKGLLTEPLTERKLAMLRQRIMNAGADLATVFQLIDGATSEPPFIPAAPEAAKSLRAAACHPGVADLDAHRSKRRPRP